MKDLTLSAQLYTLRNYTQTEADFLKTLIKIKEMGYTDAQYSAVGPLDPHFVKECLNTVDITLTATHSSPDRMKNDLDNLIKEHQLWGSKFMGIGMMQEEYREDADSVKRFAKEYSEIGKKVKDAGLQLIYHNHDFEFQRFDNKLIMDILADETDPEYMEFEIDTYWVQSGGASPAQWIRKLGDRVRFIHFKDMAMNGREQIFAPIGDGNLNWNEIIKACKETSVEYCSVEYDSGNVDPFEVLKRSYDFISTKTDFMEK